MEETQSKKKCVYILISSSIPNIVEWTLRGILQRSGERINNLMPSVFPTRCWCGINFYGYNSQVQNTWDHTSFQFQCQHCWCLLSKILKWPNFKGHSTYLLRSFVFKGKFKCLEVPLPMSQRKVIQERKKITTAKPNLTSCRHPQVKLVARGLAGSYIGELCQLANI